MNIKKFKFKIIANKIPIVHNFLLQYIENKSLTRLLCEIYYEDVLIAKGVILDYYKEFYNNGAITKIKGNIDYYGNFRDIKTPAGERIYKMKYYKNPPLPKQDREEYINELSYLLIQFINLFLWESDINILTFIPSSLKIPDEIAYKISQKIKIPLKNIISKKNNQESKNLSLKEQSFDKYEINFDKINKNDIFLVIDDVVGTGATFCEIMYKLYYFNKKVNYFLAVVKDVKR
jgi:hypothetical protein